MKLAALAVLALAGLTLAVGVGYRAWRHHAIAAETAIDPARGIDETQYVRVGGIEQWISIRGRNRDNPVILLLHGGPGIALSVMPRNLLWSWTGDFTVVQWDQRGAGKTFGRSGPVGADVTIDRMVRDGVELAEFLREHLHKKKIVLAGVSWGSMLGVHIVKARPDLFYAYVGSGQAVNQGVFKAVAYRQLLAEARSRNDRKAIGELEANGPPPYDTVAKATVHTKWANAYEAGQPSTAQLASIVLFDSEAGVGDLRDYISGIGTSQDHFREAVDREDLRALGTRFEVPFFIFQGAKDNVTPIAPVREYFDTIISPRKEMVIIPGGGHNVAITMSGEFLKLLVDRVKPLALESR
jgi:pimeloyl-ACP methyl ester carboxylesterase